MKKSSAAAANASAWGSDCMKDRLRKNSFLVIGRAGLDLYADPPGSEVESASAFSAALGGSAANIAVAIARQGGRAALFGAVSDDAVGRFTERALDAYGIDTRHVRRVGGEARTSLAVVETRLVNCQSVIYRNGAADFAITAENAEAIDYASFAAVIATGTALAQNPSRDATLRALHLARAAGLVTVIDIDYRPYSWASGAEARATCLAAAGLCDIVVGNDEEFSVLTGGHDGLPLAQDMGSPPGRIVVYKMGDRGSITIADGNRFETPVFPVRALKPTGAGDGFMGGFMSGLAAGLSLPDAVRRGSATAAIVVTRVGCAPAMPDASGVESFLLGHTG